MPVVARNLGWLRGLKDFPVDFGSRMHELVSDLIGGVNTVEQQTNSNIQGTPQAPTQPQAFTVVPHPQGVQFAIRHDGDFYQGIHYEIDANSGNVTHTYDVGSSRNGVIPVAGLSARYQVRARYLTGESSSPRAFPDIVTGGSGTHDLLPSEGAGTTKRGQPPGFGGAYRGSTPPPRNQ